jgi:hypothetical protein
VPARESALERVVGKLTAYPLLASIQLESSASLDQAYRIAARDVLFRSPTRPRAVDRIVATSRRFADLQVMQYREHGRRHHRFFLPLHRTPAARVHVRVTPAGPAVVLWDGEPARVIAGAEPPGYVGFDVRSGSAPSSVWLEVVTAADAELLELVLEGP